jgi:hypothetical protein
MSGHNAWPSGFTKESCAFRGGVFDGSSIWMIPENADRVVQVHVANGSMTGYTSLVFSPYHRFISALLVFIWCQQLTVIHHPPAST